jgi:hypothetical protein
VEAWKKQILFRILTQPIGFTGTRAVFPAKELSGYTVYCHFQNEFRLTHPGERKDIYISISMYLSISIYIYFDI